MTTFPKAITACFSRPLGLLDVGARGGLQYPWNRLRPGINAILVEPDAEESARLRNASEGADLIVVPYALWSRDGDVDLRITRSPGCSSVLEPNQELLAQFPDSQRYGVERIVKVPARTVDSLRASREMPLFDFAKLDVQGGELEVLRGGRQSFSQELVGLELEVEFAELYIGQPLFSDVEAFVREELGLCVWDIRKTYWKHAAGTHIGPTKGQLVFGDALFFRPLGTMPGYLESHGAEAGRQKLIAAMICAMAYGYADYAFALTDMTIAKELVTPQELVQVRGAIGRTPRGLRWGVTGSALLYTILDAVSRVFKPTHEGWASIGQRLGSKKRGPFWT
jgi:FkbM family methyltransferase